MQKWEYTDFGEKKLDSVINAFEKKINTVISAFERIKSYGK